MASVPEPIPGAPPEAPGPEWSGDALRDPHGAPDKADRVRRMFDAIAPRYDLNNRVHSFGRDRSWRRFAVDEARVRSTDHVLDVACGTGDLSMAFAKGGAARVVGLDFSSLMLDGARHKLTRHPAADGQSVEFIEGDAQDLPFPDASFDVVSIAFGIRNVQSVETALSEFARVLRPGGRLVVLELAEPRSRLLRGLNRMYTRGIMPRTATLISGDKSGAYKYLPRSISSFATPDDLQQMGLRAGLEPVSLSRLTLGTCVCLVWRRP